MRRHIPSGRKLQPGNTKNTSNAYNTVPVLVAVGDFNNDGAADLAVMNEANSFGATGFVSILLATATEPSATA